MDKDSLVKKAIFPHQSLVPGKEVELNNEGEVTICYVADIIPMEGNKFIVWLKTASEKIRIYWLLGKFHLNMPDGPEVTII